MNVQYAMADVTVNGEDIEVIPGDRAAAALYDCRPSRVRRRDAGGAGLPVQLRLNVPTMPLNGGLVAAAAGQSKAHVSGSMVSFPARIGHFGDLQGVRSPIGRWWLKSLVVQRPRLLDAPLDLRQSTDDAVVTLSPITSASSPARCATRGAPADDRSYVVVFSVDRASWFFNSRRIAAVQPDPRGALQRSRNLPPGEYRVAPATDLEQGEWFDPAVLERSCSAATPLTIAGPENA